MMKKLTLTIVIPVYNEENYLKRCLDAIKAQHVAPDEVIVVDNNSTDRSVAIAQGYPFVKIIKEKRQGIVYARNKGFDAALGDVICRIDADTELHPEWVGVVKDLSEDMETNRAMTGPCEFYDSSTPKLTFAFHRVIYFWLSRLFFGHTILFGSNMFFFNENWKIVRSEACKNNDIHEDMDLAAHIVELGGSITFTSKLPASASARRFHNWRYYPTKWSRTWQIHGFLPTRYKSIRQIYKDGEY